MRQSYHSFKLLRLLILGLWNIIQRLFFLMVKDKWVCTGFALLFNVWVWCRIYTINRAAYEVSLSLGDTVGFLWVPPHLSIHFDYIFIYMIFFMRLCDISQTWFGVLLTFVLTHRVRFSKILVQTMAEWVAYLRGKMIGSNVVQKHPKFDLTIISRYMHTFDS